MILFKNRLFAIVYFFTLAGIIVWLGLIFLAPLLRYLDSPFHAVIYAAFAPTCHQEPSRCFFIFSYPLAVCARCLGIYGGFFLGTISFPFISNSKKPELPTNRIFFLFSFPIVTDTAGNFLGLWSTSGVLRLISGLIWGVILPYYFITGIFEAFDKKRVVKKNVTNKIEVPTKTNNQEH